MPDRANADRRHKIARSKYRVTNRPDCDAAQVGRESLTVWMTEKTIAAWLAPLIGRQGGQAVYSNLAIETGTEGALRSIAALLDAGIPISDHTTFSRRGGGPTVRMKRTERDKPLPLLVGRPGVRRSPSWN